MPAPVRPKPTVPDRGWSTWTAANATDPASAWSWSAWAAGPTRTGAAASQADAETAARAAYAELSGGAGAG
jgi:hypothetical protein